MEEDIIRVMDLSQIPKNFTGLVEFPDGGREWYKDGKRHRDGDEPAIIESDGKLFYYKNGKQHRGNGLPAIICADGEVFYIINDIQVTREAAEIYAGLFSESNSNGI